MLVLRHLPTLRRFILCDPGNSLSPLALCPIYGAQYITITVAIAVPEFTDRVEVSKCVGVFDNRAGNGVSVGVEVSIIWRLRC